AVHPSLHARIPHHRAPEQIGSAATHDTHCRVALPHTALGPVSAVVRTGPGASLDRPGTSRGCPGMLASNTITPWALAGAPAASVTFAQCCSTSRSPGGSGRTAHHSRGLLGFAANT